MIHFFGKNMIIKKCLCFLSNFGIKRSLFDKPKTNFYDDDFFQKNASSTFEYAFYFTLRIFLKLIKILPYLSKPEKNNPPFFSPNFGSFFVFFSGNFLDFSGNFPKKSLPILEGSTRCFSREKKSKKY